MGPKKLGEKVGVGELEEIMQIKALWGHGIPKSPNFQLSSPCQTRMADSIKPKLPMARVYKAKYFPYDDIFNAKLGSNPSYAWRSIFNSLEVIRKSLDGGWEMARESIFGMTSGFQLQPLIK